MKKVKMKIVLQQPPEAVGALGSTFQKDSKPQGFLPPFWQSPARSSDPAEPFLDL